MLEGACPLKALAVMYMFAPRARRLEEVRILVSLLVLIVGLADLSNRAKSITKPLSNLLTPRTTYC
jgi:hypothetical protein